MISYDTLIGILVLLIIVTVIVASFINLFRKKTVPVDEYSVQTNKFTFPYDFIIRLLIILMSSYVSYKVFYSSYDEFDSYLPAYSKLQEINNATSTSSLLRENTMGLREIFTNAFEKSTIYAAISFLISAGSLEYIRRGIMRKYESKNQ